VISLKWAFSLFRMTDLNWIRKWQSLQTKVENKTSIDPATIRYISWKFSVSCWSLPEPIGLFSNSFYMCSYSVWFNHCFLPTWSEESPGNSYPVC
jgi:hypothetical protein